MKKFVFFIVSLLFFSCIQKRTLSDTEEPTNNVLETDTIIESVALIEDDTLFEVKGRLYRGIIEYPLEVKVLSVAPHHNFEYHNEKIMADASYEDTLILITDDERMFHDIIFKEDSLRKSYPDYRFDGDDWDDYEAPFEVFMRKKGDVIYFLGRPDDRLLYLDDAYISKGPFSIGPFHIGMTQKEMADSIGIPIEMTKAYKCVALLYGNRFTLLKNMKHPKPWGGPDFSKIFIGYADKVTKIIVVGLDEGERVLDGPEILGRPKDWE